MPSPLNKVHPDLEITCPELSQGLDFKISKEGKIECNISIDIIHAFLDKHCPDRKFIRTGKFKDDFSKAVENVADSDDVDEHKHFCKTMGIRYKENTSKPKRIVVIPRIDLPLEVISSELVFPDPAKAVLVYIFMNDALFSIQPSMLVYAQQDLKMLSLANPIKHYPTCIFMTSQGPKSCEERRPIFHLVDRKLILQATDSPINKIRKAESGLKRSQGQLQTEETTASTVYVSHEGKLYSMKLAQFDTLVKDFTSLSSCKTLKHLPTCVYLANDVLYSNDIKRPMYIHVDGKLIQILELETV